MDKTVIAVAVALAAGACGDGGSTAGAVRGAPDTTRMAQLILTLPAGVDTFDYSITGGPAENSRGGSIGPSGGELLKFDVGQLPSGPGYVFAVRAATSAGDACAGAAPFGN